MSKIIVQYSRILINDYDLGDCPKLEKYLSIWDKARFCYVPIGYFYDEEKRQLRIPRGIDVMFVEKLLNEISVMSYEPDPYDRCSIKATMFPRDDIQKKSIAFLVGEQGFEYTTKYSQLALTLATGTGKTYVTCAASQFFNTKIMVITPIDRIKKQWYESFINMTDVTESQIYDMDSSTAIEKLYDMKKLPYKVYIVNHGTLNAYAKSHGWDEVHELFRYIKIGVKVYDEAHLNFENTIRIDLNTNTKRTIYLTATFERSDNDQNRVFNRCFNNVVKYGVELRKDMRKHIMFLGIMYNSNPSVIDEASMMTIRGWNKNAFAKYQLHDKEFFNALLYAIKYFTNYEGKILILSTTIELVDKITEFIKENFPDYSVASLHSKINDSERDNVLSADIISSTPKSAGTGVDIKGLRTVIMTEAYSSKVQADQVPGRLREYSDSAKTFYVELIDKGFSHAYTMYCRRLPVLKKKCKKILTVDLVNKDNWKNKG